MRLIDADTLELDADWDKYEDGFTAYSEMQIDNAETVKAIPIERLEQIRAEIEERVKPLVWKQKCVNEIMEIIDKALKEQNE